MGGWGGWTGDWGRGEGASQGQKKGAEALRPSGPNRRNCNNLSLPALRWGHGINIGMRNSELHGLAGCGDEFLQKKPASLLVDPAGLSRRTSYNLSDYLERI
jgi:hypothetical protein